MQTYLLPGGETLVNVHPYSVCQATGARPCAIHNMTDHVLRGMPQHFRSDRGIMERICEHGVGHPDPDDLYFQIVIRGDESAGVHGCDGCCRA